jgi:hypothetical protein
VFFDYLWKAMLLLCACFYMSNAIAALLKYYPLTFVLIRSI